MKDSKEIKPKIPRESWDEEFKRAIAESDKDELIGDNVQNDFDKIEWQ